MGKKKAVNTEETKEVEIEVEAKTTTKKSKKITKEDDQANVQQIILPEVMEGDGDSLEVVDDTNALGFLEDINNRGLVINGSYNTVIIQYGSTSGDIRSEISLRAEGGGQVNTDVGTNANQGGQNAIDHSQSGNDQSQFADGNGRSGIAGCDNDEMGGQQGIKIRDSEVEDSAIQSAEEFDEGSVDDAYEEGFVDESVSDVNYDDDSNYIAEADHASNSN